MVFMIMDNGHQHDAIEVFVSPAGNDSADGSRANPYSSLRHALTAVGERNKTEAGEIRYRRKLTITALSTDTRPSGANKVPQYDFYIDSRATEIGEGTQGNPWPNLDVALADLVKRVDDGHVTLNTGNSLQVTRREVFAATPHEKRKQFRQAVAKWLLWGMTLACVLPVVAILGYLIVSAWPALTWEFLFANPKDYFTAGGIWSPLIGTFFLVLCSLLVAAPIGVLAGVYLNEYARDNWATRIINLAVVNLAGVPSIVHALFGVGAFVYFMGMGRSLLAASCTVAVMTLPVIITSTREALASVPMSFREACWSLGASRWQTIRTLVLPNSIAGILTGVILQVARAAGETAPILFTGAVLFVPVADSGWKSLVPYSLGDRFMALSYHLYALSTQIRGASEASMYATAVVLIGLVLLVNSVSIGLRIYLRSQKKW
jgi:phosphate transport system permease protein